MPLYLGTNPVPFVPSPNHSSRRGKPIELIVLHSTGGPFQSSVRWLCDKRSKVSAHFVISRAGELVQLVELGRAAWHAGKAEYRGLRDINSRSIGIELEHIDAHQDWPQEQIDMLHTLLRWLLHEYNLTPQDVVGHNDVALPKGRKVDPYDFAWERLRSGLGTPRTVRPAGVVPVLKYGDVQIRGRIIADTLYVPARPLCELFGKQLRWDSRELEALVTDN